MFDQFNNQNYRNLQNLIAEKLKLSSSGIKRTSKSKSGFGEPIPPIDDKQVEQKPSTEVISPSVQSDSETKPESSSVSDTESKPKPTQFSVKYLSPLSASSTMTKPKPSSTIESKPKVTPAPVVFPKPTEPTPAKSEDEYDTEVEKRKKEIEAESEKERMSSWEAEQKKRSDWYSNEENRKKAVEWDARNPRPENSGYALIQWQQKRREAGISDTPEKKYRPINTIFSNKKSEGPKPYY